MSDDIPNVKDFLGDGTEENPEFVPGRMKSHGGGVKRDIPQRERDLVEIARLHLHGYSQEEIASNLSKGRGYTLTQQTISLDMKEIQARWRQSYLSDFDTLKARELAHIDELEKAYWLAWERSMRDQEETKSLLIEDKSGSVKGVTTPLFERKKVEHKKTERDGSVEFLQGIQWCVEQRCKILGINAPQKYEIDWRSEAQKAGLNPGDIFNTIVGEYMKDTKNGAIDANFKSSELGRTHDEGSLDGSSEDFEDQGTTE